MKHGSEWYKREPTAYLGGVQGLTAKEHAVYSVVLELIYQHGGSVNDDPSWIAGWIKDMGSASVRATISSLIERGKLAREGDQLTQKRAKTEAKTKENLREIREKMGRKGGDASAKSMAALNESNDLRQPIGSPREEKRREEKNNSSSMCASADDVESKDDQQKDGEWTADRLLDEVLSAAGLKSGPIPAYWMPPASTAAVWRWVTDLKLTPEKIIDAVHESRKRHDQPPGGPKALDRVMQTLSGTINAPALQPITSAFPQRPAPLRIAAQLKE